MVAAAAEGFGADLEFAEVRIGTALQGSEAEIVAHIAAGERDSGPGMDSVTPESFPACPMLSYRSWLS